MDIDLSKILELLQQGSYVVGALLAILGGLKLLARLTKAEWDDRVLDAAEKPLRAIQSLLARKDKDK
jgi:hypothetical protein